MSFKKLFFLTIMVFCSITLQAQTDNDPVWYKMMHDPNVNYYAAVKSYQDFWKDKKMPPNKEQRQTEEYKAFFAKMTPAERQAYERLFWLNKEFKNWTIEQEPWVQPDGRILTQDERNAIINKQQAELREIERKNGKN